MMMNKFIASVQPKNQNSESAEDNVEGYPIYPASDDIYSQSENEIDIDPENISQQKTPNEPNHELDLNDDEFGGDLDVPGAELDDAREDIGNEDEENNYYSIGGDAHDD